MLGKLIARITCCSRKANELGNMTLHRRHYLLVVYLKVRAKGKAINVMTRNNAGCQEGRLRGATKNEGASEGYAFVGTQKAPTAMAGA